jgi:hypothetical protein
MSRGLGRIEQAIVAMEEEESLYGFLLTARDVVNEIYKDQDRTRSQDVAVLRAMHSLARKYPEQFVLAGGKGRDPLWIGSPRSIELRIANRQRSTRRP